MQQPAAVPQSVAAAGFGWCAQWSRLPLWLSKNTNSHSPVIYGLKSLGCRWISVDFAGMKKEQRPLLSMTYRRQWRSVDYKLERETRLELATSTLARLRSTN